MTDSEGPPVYMWFVPLGVVVFVLAVLFYLKREYGDEIIPLHEGKPLEYKPTRADLLNYRRRRKGLPPLTSEEEAEANKEQSRLPAKLKKWLDDLEEKLEQRLYK